MESSASSFDYVQYLTTASSLIQVGAVLLFSVIFALLAPVFGCLFAGIDRKISARMQGRVGPSLLQPYYDLRKLLNKDKKSVNGSENTYITTALIFVFFAGGIFFCGANILLCIFILTLSSLLFIMAAFCARSPYSEIGGMREILQVLSYEPAVILMCVGFYLVTKSFRVSSVTDISTPLITSLWPIFLSLVFILVIKFRKSPFDLSMSHHLHQEIVRGVTTEMSGSVLAKVEILHWCENVLFMGWVSMFFLCSNPISILYCIIACILVYFFVIFVDNNFARIKWCAMLKYTWIAIFVLCVPNIIFLLFI